MKRTIHVLVATSLALGAITAQLPGPAAACVSAPAPFDSFTAAVPAAGVIVIGTAEGLSSRELHNKFRLRVDEVLRGTAPAAMRFSGLSGGDTRSACGDRSTVIVRDGARLALAMSAPKAGQPSNVEAVAFVGKSQPFQRNMPGVERLPAAKVRQLAGSADRASADSRYDPGPAADGLFIERVAQGTARVRALGNAHDVRSVRYLDIDADDRVWAASPDRAFKLAARQEYAVDGPSRLSAIEAVSDGEMLATANGIWHSNGDKAWYRLGSAADGGLHSPHETPDGSVWALSAIGPTRLEEYEWTYADWEDVGLPDGCFSGDKFVCDPTAYRDAPDGSLWFGFAGSSPEDPTGGIRRFYGSGWTEVPSPVDGPYAVLRLASEPTGPVWALVGTEDEPGSSMSRRLARWDGQSWTLSDLPADVDPDTLLVAGPGDVVWLSSPLARFDGQAWTSFAVPGRAGPERSRVTDLSIAPDGSAWMVVHRLTGSGATRPDGIYILDPARAIASQGIDATGAGGQDA